MDERPVDEVRERGGVDATREGSTRWTKRTKSCIEGGLEEGTKKGKGLLSQNCGSWADGPDRQKEAASGMANLIARLLGAQGRLQGPLPVPAPALGVDA